MTPSTLSFVQNVAFPFVRAWSGFEPCNNQQRDLRHLAQEIYRPVDVQHLPKTSRDVLNDYHKLFRDLRNILKREPAPLYLGKFRRDWHLTASRVIDELVQLSHDITDKATVIGDADGYQAFQDSVRLFADKVQESHDKFWQMEIGMRVALGINEGEEASFLSPDPGASESS